MLDPISLSLLLGAGVSLVGNYLGASSVEDTNLQNKKLFERQLQHQSDMQQKQMDFQTKERLATQDYNSPLNQAKLYSQAGMNPLAMFQNGNSFVPTSAQTGGQGSAPSAPMMQAFQPDLSGISNFASQFAASRKSEKEADLLETQNDFARQKYALEITKLRAEAENIQGDTDYKRKLINYCDKELELLEKTLPSSVEQRKEEARLAGIRADDAQREYEENILTRQLRVAMVNQQFNINEATLQNIVSHTVLLREQALSEGVKRKALRQDIAESVSRELINNQARILNMPVETYIKEHPDEVKNLKRIGEWLGVAATGSKIAAPWFSRGF